MDLSRLPKNRQPIGEVNFYSEDHGAVLYRMNSDAHWTDERDDAKRNIGDAYVTIQASGKVIADDDNDD